MPRLVLLSLLGGTLLLAQTPNEPFDPLHDPSLVEKGLQSTMPLQVAISAYRAINIVNRQRSEWLRGALQRSSSLGPEYEARRARGVILDALIRTGTQVPLDELLPFFDELPAAVIAIVAKSGSSGGEDRMPLLKKTEEAKNPTYWYAAASIMERKQLIHYLIQQVHFDYAISVVDTDLVTFPVYEGPGVAGGVIGGVIGGVPADSQVTWPEETHYSLEMSGDMDQYLTCCIGGATYLKARPRGVHAFDEGHSADPRMWANHDRDVVRILTSIAHCAVCSDNRGDYPNVRGGKATIVWHSAEQARPLLEKAIEWYVKGCVGLLIALSENGISEAEIRSKVRIWIRDWRQVKTDRIPAVGAGLEFNRCEQVQSEMYKGHCLDN